LVIAIGCNEMQRVQRKAWELIVDPSGAFVRPRVRRAENLFAVFSVTTSWEATQITRSTRNPTFNRNAGLCRLYGGIDEKSALRYC
jgi:hypothetical protein